LILVSNFIQMKCIMFLITSEIAFLCYLFLVSSPAFSQEITIYGTVSNLDLAPLSGVKVKVNNNNLYYQQVKTYVNPVLPGDHPDPTLLKVGDDFYHCGSSFHITPYLPVYHSKDMVHWEMIGRVLLPSKVNWVSDHPSGGVWQGAITYFYGSYWIFFSSDGQWFCKAKSPAGPWSDPVQVQTNSETGNLGYDNSIFIDDDGTPYMVIKNGQKINRLQALGKDGQLRGKVINLDWINAKLQYSWAEGPVMCKRNGYYFYFPAGDVSGGQYVLRTKELTADSTKWERLGNFFKPVTDAKAGFRRPNHISAPLSLADGTWWTLGQSYETYPGDDWSGMGRQISLYPVIWEGNRPWGMAPTSQPIVKPDLPQSGILCRSVQSDDFDTDVLSADWHFLNKKAAAGYSLSDRKGWIRLTPPNGERTHLLQKETDHYYTVVTKVDLDASESASKGGIYLTNGDQKAVLRFYTGYDIGKKIILNFDTATRIVENRFGNVIWLKLERYEHLLTGYYSGDGQNWISSGAPVNTKNLDKAQPNFNSWVGTSLGLFSEGKPADFDFFICKDGYSTLPAIGYHNYFGIGTVQKNGTKAVTNTSENGGWLMISGVDLGRNTAKAIEITAVSGVQGMVEIWLDDLNTGKLVANIPVNKTGDKENHWQLFTQPVKDLCGHHDVFLKFPQNSKGEIVVQSIRFIK
jgi:xylan 1,4-beta-xylosidase